MACWGGHIFLSINPSCLIESKTEGIKVTLGNVRGDYHGYFQKLIEFRESNLVGTGRSEDVES
jgi:hypothetical protein